MVTGEIVKERHDLTSYHRIDNFVDLGRRNYPWGKLC